MIKGIPAYLAFLFGGIMERLVKELKKEAKQAGRKDLELTRIEEGDKVWIVLL